jgi:hypothetical protein
LTTGAAGAAEVDADEPAAGAALAAVGALGAEALELEADVPLDAVDPLLSLGGSTATPPLPPPAGVAAVEPAEEPLVVAGALVVEPPAEACADGAGALDEPLDDDEAAGEDDVEGDVAEGVAAEGAELCAVELCAAGVLVRVLCPTGKNEPPVMSVAMMPAITATRAMPISRSGQLRRSQSMVPF